MEIFEYYDIKDYNIEDCHGFVNDYYYHGFVNDYYFHFFINH